MDWQFLFDIDDEDEKCTHKIIEIFVKKFGDDMDTNYVLKIVANAMITASSAAGMSHKDFSDMLGALGSEYIGW